MNNDKRIGIFIFLVLVVLTASSWGFLVHKTTTQLAMYQAPKELKKFYYKNMDYMIYNSVRPDVRRNTDSTEATRHFIDLEVFGDSAEWKIPVTWNEAVGTYTKDTLIKYGYLPYVILSQKERLTSAFRSRNVDSILFYSADIAHYIADANVPLHTTINYDGQLTNQKGMHSLWESMVPEIEITHYNLRSRHDAQYLKDPFQTIMNAVRQAYALVPDVFSKEREVSKGFTDSQKYRVQVRRGRESRSYTSDFAKAYAASLKTTINDQLLYSADMIADFWFTCWVDAGKPDLDGLLKSPFSKTDKRALKREYKSFKKNRLIEDSFLRAKRVISGASE